MTEDSNIEDDNVAEDPEIQALLKDYPAPQAEPSKPFSMLATILEADPYLGRVLTGRIASGVARLNIPLAAMGQANPADGLGKLHDEVLSKVA